MSGGSSAVPTAYNPANQPGADQTFTSGLNALSGYGSNLAGSAIPQYSAINNAVQNNPYYNAAQGASNLASYLGQSAVGPSQLQGAAALQNTGNQAGAATGQIYNQNAIGTGGQILNQATGQANQIANSGYINTAQGILNNGLNQAGQVQNNGTTDASILNLIGDLGQSNAIGGSNYLGQAQNLLGQSIGAGDAILNTAFDPQQTLYNQQYQQNLDQTNAINAMNGVNGPYAAGVSDLANLNFNTNWQNQQLGREATGINAFDSALAGGVSDYSGLVGAATGAQSNLQNAGFGNYNSTLGANTSAANSDISTGVSGYGGVLGSGSGTYGNLINTGTGAYSGLTGAETSALSQLGGLQTQSYDASANLGNTGLNTINTAGALPSSTYLGQQNADLSALNSLVSGTNNANSLTQQSIGDAGNYLGIGQNATTVNQAAQEQQYQQTAGLFSSLTNLLGLGAGANSSSILQLAGLV